MFLEHCWNEVCYMGMSGRGGRGVCRKTVGIKDCSLFTLEFWGEGVVNRLAKDLFIFIKEGFEFRAAFLMFSGNFGQPR